MPNYRELNRETARGGSFGLLWTVIAIIVIALLSWGIWFVTVGTSDVRGQGNAIITKNSSENRIAAQQRFEKMYANVVATDAKISVAAQDLALNPNDKTAQDNLIGTKNVCLSMVADYNAEARSFISEDFRAFDLPEQISPTDPTTDCQE